MIDWINQNKEILFSGLGATIVGSFLKKLFNNKTHEKNSNDASRGLGNSIPSKEVEFAQQNTSSARTSLEEQKLKTKILFIDDDTKFKVSKILINSGWINTTIIKDAKTLDDLAIKNANILFVDVQGVGIAMGFDSEGLGLALALKEKYPSKKIIIYSAETNGDRFHEALRKADSFLPKNADPYEFQKLVEELSVDI